VDRETLTIMNALEALRVPYARWLLLCLMVVCSSLACTPQPKLVGPTVPSGYFFVVRVSDIKTERLPASTELTVRVQDAQGQPVDGVPVEFQMESAGERIGSVSPQHAPLPTAAQPGQSSRRRAPGRAPVLVRVEKTTQEAIITVIVEDDPD
jgi:hypothetical protein